LAMRALFARFHCKSVCPQKATTTNVAFALRVDVEMLTIWTWATI
jgi:hypothetical protein